MNVSAGAHIKSNHSHTKNSNQSGPNLSDLVVSYNQLQLHSNQCSFVVVFCLFSLHARANFIDDFPSQYKFDGNFIWLFFQLDVILSIKITSLEFGLEHNEISVTFPLEWKIVSEMGPAGTQFNTWSVCVLKIATTLWYFYFKSVIILSKNLRMSYISMIGHAIYSFTGCNHADTIKDHHRRILPFSPE